MGLSLSSHFVDCEVRLAKVARFRAYGGAILFCLSDAPKVWNMENPSGSFLLK